MISQHQQDPKIVDIFTRQAFDPASKRVVRIAPELDGMEMLYSNDNSGDKLYSLKVAFWALQENGEVYGMVPWLNQIMRCPDINDPLNGRFEGYRDPGIDEIFYEPPQHKAAELEFAAQYYEYDTSDHGDIIQELPDAIGTHAVLTANGFRSFKLIEVFSWRLCGDGTVQAMLVDDESVTSTPVLPGDTCLYEAQEDSDFRYFFQHRIANKIKEQDPEALAAISLLIEN